MDSKKVFYRTIVYQRKENGFEKQQSFVHAPIEESENFFCTFFVAKTSSSDFQRFVIGIDQPYPNFSLHNRMENCLILNFILSGTGMINTIPLQPGYCYYTIPGELHTMVADRKQPWRSVWLTLDGEYAKQVQNRLSQMGKSHILRFEHGNSLRRLIEFLLWSIKVNELQNLESFLMGCAEQILSFLLKDEPDDDNASLHREANLKQDMVIKKAIRLIHSNISSITVNSLAERMKLNRKYFSNLFFSVTGIQPQAYIIDQKMKLATDLLLESDLTLDEIAEGLGYSHRNGFEIAFRKKYNCTPTKYRYQTIRNAIDSKQTDTNEGPVSQEISEEDILDKTEHTANEKMILKKGGTS